MFLLFCDFGFTHDISTDRFTGIQSDMVQRINGEDYRDRDDNAALWYQSFHTDGCYQRTAGSAAPWYYTLRNCRFLSRGIIDYSTEPQYLVAQHYVVLESRYLQKKDPRLFLQPVFSTVDYRCLMVSIRL